MSQNLTDFTISKLLGVGALVAVLGAGYQIKSSAAAHDEALFLGHLSNTVREYCKADSDAQYASAANLITVKKIQADRVSGTTITGKWGGVVAVAPANIGGAANDGFTFTESAPTSQCESLAKDMTSWADTILIGGTSVKSYGGTLTTNGASGVAALCSAAATVSMTFGFIK